MKLIVAVDNNWGIGYRGELLCRISADLKNFREETLGKTVILGSKTLSTFPGGRPLKNRRNIILSRNKALSIENAELAHSAEEAISLSGLGDDVVVIGGESIYRLFLPYCDTAIVTKFERTFESDAFFPNLDESDEWTRYSESESFLSDENDSEQNMKFRFCIYKKQK